MSEQTPNSPVPSGMQRQQQIYTLGLTGGSLSIPISLSLLEHKAKEILPPPAFDYVAGERAARTRCALIAKPFTAGGSCHACFAMYPSAT
jgi:hypothetical protein